VEFVIEQLARKGRGRDTDIAHVAPGEVVLPGTFLAKHPTLAAALEKALFEDAFLSLSERTVGHPDVSINPKTGLQEFDDGDGGDGDGGADGGDAGGGDTEGSASDAAAEGATSAEGGTPGTAGMSEGLGAGDTGLGGETIGEGGGGDGIGPGGKLFGDPIEAAVARRQGRYTTYSDRDKQAVADAIERDNAFLKTWDNPDTTVVEEPRGEARRFFGSGDLAARMAEIQAQEQAAQAKLSNVNPFAYKGGMDKLYSTNSWSGGFGTLYG